MFHVMSVIGLLRDFIQYGTLEGLQSIRLLKYLDPSTLGARYSWIRRASGKSLTKAIVLRVVDKERITEDFLNTFIISVYNNSLNSPHFNCCHVKYCD